MKGSERVTVKYGQREKESYGGNKKEWMDGVHYVNTFVRLMNVCTVSTIPKCCFLVNNCNVIWGRNDNSCNILHLLILRDVFFYRHFVSSKLVLPVGGTSQPEVTYIIVYITYTLLFSGICDFYFPIVSWLNLPTGNGVVSPLHHIHTAVSRLVWFLYRY